MTTELRFHQLPLLLPVVFALHCIDEFPTFISFGDSHGIILPPSNPLELVAAMVGFLVVIAVLSLLAYRAPGPGHWRMTLWMVFFAAILVHSVLNVAGSLWLREYVPGTVVAAGLYLPGGVYVLRRAVREGWILASGSARSSVLGWFCTWGWQRCCSRPAERCVPV